LENIIKLGDGKEIEKKFRRLLIFYQQVLTKTGFDKYEVIDVQYKGQIVTLKVNDNSKMDSARIKQNIEKVLQNAREAQDDSALSPMPGKDQIGQDKNTSVNAVNSVLRKKGVKKVKKTKEPETVQPKAIMKKKPVEDMSNGYN
jgi:cell division protein FtsQ